MILPFAGKYPQLGASIFVADTSSVIGDVKIGTRSSVWFGAVLRGDDHYIRIGDETNIQDNSVIHVGLGELPTIVGNRVTIGHSVTLHGSTVGDLCIVGMGSTILDGCEIGERCLVAAGSLLAPGTRIPPGTLVLGAPARVKRDLKPDEIEHLTVSATNYVALGARYLAEAWYRPPTPPPPEGPAKGQRSGGPK